MSKNAHEILEEIQKLIGKGDSDYRAIYKLSNELSKLDPKFQRFTIDAKTLIHLGRDSIKDHTTALIELVKNSYDADAYNIDVDIFSNTKNNIRVADNGFGMTAEQLLNNWLRIGFSDKRQSKISDLGRRKTGEKGIGRISTDRLGANLELRSKTESDGIVGLKINWDEFDAEGKDVFDIDVELTRPQIINIPKKLGKESSSGTEIIITNLRQPWSGSDIESLYIELSALTSPFKKVDDFAINLQNDISPEFSHKVNSKFFETAEINVTVIYDGTDEIYYEIKDKYSKESKIETIPLLQFVQKNIKKSEYKANSSMLKCGKIEIRLMFFLRESSSIVGTDFKLHDLREFLDNNMGVKIYRDNIAVKPYGFPKAQMGYDWLGLGEEKAKNPAGIGRGDEFTVSPNQLVGAVFISRDNNDLLTDSAAREGLVQSEAFADMKRLVKMSITLLESHRAEIYPVIEKTKRSKKKIPAHREVELIKEQLSSVSENLNSIKQEIESNNDIKPTTLLKPISNTIDNVDSIKVNVVDTITILLNWQRTINGLATIGISSAVFGHETEGSITQFQGSTNTAIKLIKEVPPFINVALQELDKALNSSQKVASWGAYALTRVQKEKRKLTSVNIFETAQTVVNELKPAFDASSIELKIQGDDFTSYTFQMDIETILVNLLTNAFTAALLNKVRKVLVSIDRDEVNSNGYTISVIDSGPGIAKEFAHRIFDPLFSTKDKGVDDSKSVGTGLGLTIVKSIVEELEGNISFTRDSKLKGANFKIWLPKKSQLDYAKNRNH